MNRINEQWNDAHTVKRVVDTRQLRCLLTRDERLERADEMAKAQQDFEAEEETQKEIKAGLKAKLEGLDAKRSELARVVASGAEYRPTDVETMYDFTTTTVVEVRTDTGETINHRRMTEAERQMPLPA
jgi:beta-phosphoglucomutase-like phosphatase (HAD superfamily)